MGIPTLEVLAARAARKVQPTPSMIDRLGKDQDDYRQEAYMHALALLSQVPEGVSADRYLARSMRNWVYRQWVVRRREVPCCHLERELQAPDRYPLIDRLIDSQRGVSAADWELLVAHILSGDVDRRFRMRVLRARKELRKCRN